MVLALVAYLPALLSSPGRMPADTKLYLYLDPGQLTRTAASTWDPSQFGGWVPHQLTTYLWPSGPWFWLLDTVGLPDWIAHRLWIGTLLFLGGWGVLRLARLLGLGVWPALVAAFVYQLSTYVLPYISRTSLMLLPWAALGWLTILTIRTIRTGGWKYPAVFGLVIATVAQVNPTAFLMIVPGPILWVALESAQRRVSARQVLTGSLRLGVVSVGVSIWWIAMLAIQGRYGADVLGYSETVDAVSFTSTASEVVRGLGYWLFYIRDPYAPATASSLAYQNSPLLITIGFVLTVVCLSGLVLTRWRHRSYAVALVLVGVVLAVGVHPASDPSPAMGMINDSRLALALRSSTRALPLLTLGLGLGAGSLVSATRVWGNRGRVVSIGLVALIAVNMPSIWTAQLVDDGLDRDQDAPAAWLAAAADLDRGDTSARVLQVPGAEFGAFRWGYTVDPPLPGLTDKPVLTRDLLPLGSPGVMDLLYALDNRIQAGSLDTRSVAPIARLLGVDELWLTNDQAFDRFRTPRPEPFADELSAPIAGLGEPVSYGQPTVNVPDGPMLDEEALSDPRIGTAIAPVVLRSVTDSPGTVRLASDIVVLDGSGDGLVDAAAAGFLTGHEAVFAASDLSDADRARLTGSPVRYIVTDSNRDRDEQWRGSQDAVGMTESGGPGGDTTPTDDVQRRLPRSRADDEATQTIAELDGDLVVTATSYGDLFAFLPEARAAMAVDGDPTTAWRVGAGFSPIERAITISSVESGELRLVQTQGRTSRFMIARIALDTSGGRTEVALGPESLTLGGQVVDVPATGPITITLLDIVLRPAAPPTGDAWVGFAELGPVAQEYVRPPTEVLASIEADDDLSLVFSRERVRATNRWRLDPEPRLARRFDLGVDMTGDLVVTLRLDARAGDEVLDALAGTGAGPVSNDRLVGVARARASAAFDGDPATWWASPFATALGSRLVVPIDPTRPVTEIAITQPAGEWATITAVRITVGDTTIEAPLVHDETRRATVAVPGAVGDQATIEVIATDELTTIDRRYGDTVALPVAITEIDGLAVVAVRSEPAGCREDLLTIDGSAVGLRVDYDALIAGDSVQATTCDGAPIAFGQGTHHLLSAPGTLTGIDVDLVSWATPITSDRASRAPAVDIASHSSTSWTLAAEPCPDGCWLIFGQGFNEGWNASVAQIGDLGPSVPISGGFNGWWLPPSQVPLEISVSFAPQRTLRIGLLVSAAAILACLGLLIWPRLRRRSNGPAVPPTDAGAPEATPVVDPEPVLAWLSVDLTRRQSVMAAISLVVVTGLFVAPGTALLALPLAVLTILTRRSRLIAAAGLGGLLLVAALIVRREIVYDYPPGGAWPSSFDDLHRSVLLAVTLFGVTAWSTSPPDATDATDATDLDRHQNRTPEPEADPA